MTKVEDLTSALLPVSLALEAYHNQFRLTKETCMAFLRNEQIELEDRWSWFVIVMPGVFKKEISVSEDKTLLELLGGKCPTLEWHSEYPFNQVDTETVSVEWVLMELQRMYTAIHIEDSAPELVSLGYYKKLFEKEPDLINMVKLYFMTENIGTLRIYEP